jgi:hypothetical protein
MSTVAKMSPNSILRLTPAQIEHFHNEGYLVLCHNEHNLISPSTLQQWTNEVRELPREKERWMPYDEITATGERQIMRTENFVDFHEGFSSLLHGEALTSILAQLTGDSMRLFKDKINYKLAGGNGFAAHLDAPAYDHVGEIEHTTANLAVNAAKIANGCIEVVAGSHKTDVELVDGTGEISAAWEAQATWIPVELEEGDLLIFGSHLAHRSKENMTSQPRASVYATYYNISDGQDLRNKYYQDRRLNFPPDHGMLPLESMTWYRAPMTDILFAERVPGRDYSAGVKRYGFAAPFTSIDQRASVEQAAT